MSEKGLDAFDAFDSFDSFETFQYIIQWCIVLLLMFFTFYHLTPQN